MDRVWSFPCLVLAEVYTAGESTSRLVQPRLPNMPHGGALALGNSAMSAAGALGAAELLHPDWDSRCGFESLCHCIPMLPQALIHNLCGIYKEEKSLPCVFVSTDKRDLWSSSHATDASASFLWRKPQGMSYLMDTWMSSSFLTSSHSLGTASTSRTKTSSVFGGGVL